MIFDELNEKIDGMGQRMDAKINRKIDDACSAAIELNAFSHTYCHAELDTMVNDEETLREYLLDGLSEFSLPQVDLDAITDEELNTLVLKIDNLWREYIGDVV